MAKDLVTQARKLKQTHRGEQFNVNYVPVEVIRKISINMQKYFKIRGLLCIVNIHNM